MIWLKVKRVLLPLDIYIYGYYEHTKVDRLWKRYGERPVPRRCPASSALHGDTDVGYGNGRAAAIWAVAYVTKHGKWPEKERLSKAHIFGAFALALARARWRIK
jgi:hypothetical protein